MVSKNPGTNPGLPRIAPVADYREVLAMQIILRQVATNLFFGIDSHWMFSPLDARFFDSPLAAYRFATAKAFAGVEVVLLLPDGRLGGSLPVT